MRHWIRTVCASFLLVMSVTFYAGSGANAQDVTWHVSKSSGDASIITSAAQQDSLTDGAVLKPGDSVRTGQTGRVLLTRGEESILVAPNSFIRIPIEQTDGMSTTIFQQAGTILLEVEKRNVKHFEVVTPYLAAVVKGTRFRVTVEKNNSSVDVLRGQVEVTDLQSGQIATVLPGQTADVSTQNQDGLSLSGSGALGPILQGPPRQSMVPPLAVMGEHRAAADGAVNGPKATTANKEFTLPNGSANGPKVHKPLALGERVSMPNLSSTSAENAMNFDHNWSDPSEAHVKSWWSIYVNEWLERSDVSTSNLVTPIGIGFVVAVGVAIKRQTQRKRQKNMKPSS